MTSHDDSLKPCWRAFAADLHVRSQGGVREVRKRRAYTSLARQACGRPDCRRHRVSVSFPGNVAAEDVDLFSYFPVWPDQVDRVAFRSAKAVPYAHGDVLAVRRRAEQYQ